VTRLMPCSAANLHASFSRSTLDTGYPCKQAHPAAPLFPTSRRHRHQMVARDDVRPTYPGPSRLVGYEVLDVGPGFLVQHVPVTLQLRPAGDRGRRRGQDHAPHRPGLHARPHDVQSSPDSGLDQLFLPIKQGMNVEQYEQMPSATTRQTRDGNSSSCDVTFVHLRVLRVEVHWSGVLDNRVTLSCTLGSRLLSTRQSLL
jgi:hypothetical protein